ncbi:MAG TPA: AbrB/MazE/SpoVT family DNA-binding domain-containing protein [Candidatus Eisenbacteria bacterium]|nr:AbrB/MazE/SpoVT family DNA-binding domain-containing protein [Candidatus Eisenbacteria bacterium]
MAIVKVTEKGQVTLPIDLRRKLRIGKDDYLVVEAEGEYLKLTKVAETKSLGPEDPIWSWLGKASGGKKDVSAKHDRYLAEGERKRWRRS